MSSTPEQLDSLEAVGVEVAQMLANALMVNRAIGHDWSPGEMSCGLMIMLENLIGAIEDPELRKRVTGNMEKRMAMGLFRGNVDEVARARTLDRTQTEGTA